MGQSLKFNVSARGPLFDGTGPAAIEEATREGVERLMLRGVSFAQAELYPGHGVRPNGGTLRRAIRGRALSATSAWVGLDPPLVYGAAMEFGWPRGYPGLRGQFAGYHFLETARRKLAALNANIEIGPLVVEKLGGGAAV